MSFFLLILKLLPCSRLSWPHFPIKSMSSRCLTVSCRENQMVVLEIVPKYALVVPSSPPSQMVVSLLD